MDIYFCDQCAARVTDADLHRGHGIKKADVVICGHCIEKGLGGELLAQAGMASAAPTLAGAGVLDEARDRAWTSKDLPDEDLGDEDLGDPLPIATDDAATDADRPSLFLDDDNDDDAVPPSPIGDHESQDYLEHDNHIDPADRAPLVPSDNLEVDPDLSQPAPHECETDAVRRHDSDDLVSAAGGFAALQSAPGPDSSDVDELLELGSVEAAEAEDLPLPRRGTTAWDDDDDADSDLIDEEILADVPFGSGPIVDPDELNEDSVADTTASSSSAQSVDEYEDDDDEYEDDDAYLGYEDEDEASAQGQIETLSMGRADDYDDDEDDDDEDDDGVADGADPNAPRPKRRRRGKRRRGGGAAKAAKPEKSARNARQGNASQRATTRGPSSARLASSSSSSSRATATKAGGKSSRRAPAGKKKNNLPIILGSIISVLIILILAAVFMPGALKRGGGGGTASSPVAEMRLKVERANRLAISAQQSGGLSELEAANRAIREAQELVYSLADNPPAGWTEEDLQNELRRLKFADLQGQSQNIRNRIGILQRQGQ